MSVKGAPAVEFVELPEIQRIIDMAVMRELHDPHLSEEVMQSIRARSERMIAGFPVLDRLHYKDLVNEATQALKMRLEAYQDTAAEMRETLVERGISAIAIVPLKTWERLYRPSGMYEMEIDRDGKVALDLSELEESIKDRKRFVNIAFVLLLVVATSACAVAGGMKFFDFMSSGVFGSAYRYFLSIVVGIIVAAFAFVVLGLFLFSLAQEEARFMPLFERAITRRCFASLSWKDILEKVMPDHRSSSSSQAVKATVLLPPIPDEAASVLAQARGLNLRTIVDPDAFSFEESVESLLRGQRNEVRETRRTEFNRQLPYVFLDPNVAWYKDDVVAVIVQWGDSPFEKRVVEQAASLHDLF